MNAFKAKEILSRFEGKDKICNLFKEKEQYFGVKTSELWDGYIEFMTIKALGSDTGLNNQMKYSTSCEMDELWHYHVLCTELYQEFMVLVNEINPLVNFIHHSMILSLDGRDKIEKRKQASALAYQ